MSACAICAKRPARVLASDDGRDVHVCESCYEYETGEPVPSHFVECGEGGSGCDVLIDPDEAAAARRSRVEGLDRVRFCADCWGRA